MFFVLLKEIKILFYLVIFIKICMFSENENVLMDSENIVINKYE